MNPSLLPGSKYTQPAPHSLSFISTQFYILFCLFLSYIEIQLDLLLPFFFGLFFKYLMSMETPTSSQFAYTLLHIS